MFLVGQGSFVDQMQAETYLELPAATLYSGLVTQHLLRGDLVF